MRMAPKVDQAWVHAVRKCNEAGRRPQAHTRGAWASQCSQKWSVFYKWKGLPHAGEDRRDSPLASDTPGGFRERRKDPTRSIPVQSSWGTLGKSFLSPTFGRSKNGKCFGIADAQGILSNA